MAKHYMFSVRDRKADTYGLPFFLPSPGVAVRYMEDAVNSGDSKSVMCVHPEDFELFELGVFEDSTADCSLYSKPKSLAVCDSLIRRTQ